MRVTGALAVVVAVGIAGIYFFKRFLGFGIVRGGAQELQILEMKSLGGRQAMYVVGYRSKRFVLGVSPDRIQLVCRLPDEPDSGRSTNGGESEFGPALKEELAK